MSAFILKLFAMASMMIDHLGLVLLYCGSVEGQLYMLMRSVGRMAMPVFCFFIVVGLEKSSDRKKYLHRLCLFALLSQLPFSLAFDPAAYIAPISSELSLGWAPFSPLRWLLFVCTALGLVLFFGKSCLVPCAALIALFARAELGGLRLLGEHGNVFYDLALGLAAIWLADAARRGGCKKTLLCAALVLACALLLIAPVGDYGWRALALIVPLYFCGESKWKRLGCVGLWCAAIYAGSFALCLGALGSVCLLALYNGKKGPGLKYLFYGFYPVHLCVFYLMGRLAAG